MNQNLIQAKKSSAMEIQFRRTGERRYAVTIYRNDQPPMEMNPAPGYDPLMPHDLLHFIVESELGLQQGIFGQIAIGGTAGTFFAVATAGENSRDVARLRRRAKQRGEKLLREGSEDSAQSERATSICLYEWLARSAGSGCRKRAAEMALQAKQIRRQLPATENQALSEPVVKRICARMDELSARWSALEIGQSLTVTWQGKN